MKTKVLLVLFLSLAMFMVAPSVQAFDLDPGDNGGGLDCYIKIKATYVRLAQDTDLCGPGEVYMENPGDDIWTVNNAASWEDGTHLSGSTYYGDTYWVPYNVVYEREISRDDIGTKFWFQLCEDDAVYDKMLWSGYIKIEDTGYLVGDWASAQGRGVGRDLGPVRLQTSDAAHCWVGNSIMVFNQVAFHIEFYFS